MSEPIIVSLIISLTLTIIFEMGFFLLIGKRHKKDLLLVLLVNILTNPVVVLLYWLAIMYTRWSMVFVLTPLEGLAIFIEGYYYKKYSQLFNIHIFYQL